MVTEPIESTHLKPIRTAPQLLDMYYLDMRSALLETAAAFDRLDRAQGSETINQDPRYVRLKAACQILASSEKQKTDAFLHYFSEDS